MVVNYKPSSSTFHTRLVIAVTQTADIFVTFIAIQFFFREGNKFCMVVLCDTTTWTCGNIKAKLLWLSKKGKICSSLILTIRIFFLAVKKNCMVINYKLNSSVFQKRLVKLLLTKLQIFSLNFDHRFFFIWGIKNFVWWYKVITYTWTCGNIQGKAGYTVHEWKVLLLIKLHHIIFF